MSRLDRLFTLISTSTSASARTLATKQIGEIQKTHPGELHNLLSRLHPLLRSKRWETRISAAAAIAAILKELPPFVADPVKDEDKAGIFQEYASKFNLNRIVGDGNAFLNASNGEEYEAVASASTEDQKKRLNSDMGFDMAVNLGIMKPDELVTNHDLASVGEENENLSARERNVRRRQKRKQAKEQVETSKKFKLEQQYYSVDDTEKEALSTVKWPFEKFCSVLKKDLESPVWEERHGAATALREIILLQGFCGGKSLGQSSDEMAESHAKWLDDLATEFLIVLARDRFGDFVSDQVVAPVRETSAMALGNVIKLMNRRQIQNVVEVLIELADRPDWECRHGAYLGLKYLLSAVNLDCDVTVKVVYPRAIKGLKDVVDDVVSEAAAALIPVVKQFVEKIDIGELSDLLWNCLTDLDDLTGSTQSTMKLLSEILKIKVPSNGTSSLADLVPRLFPFFHHSSSGVRKAALQTLASLVSRPTLANQFLPGICGLLMSHLFQRSLFESHEENLELIEEAWGNICDNCPLAALLTSTCPLYGNWFVLISKPHMWPLPNELLINAKKEDQQFLGGPQAQQASNDLMRNNLATRARCLGARMLGKLAGFIAQPVPGFDYNKELLTPVQMFTQKILLVNLTKSAFQCTAIALLIMGWSQFHQVQVKEKAPEELKLALWKYLASTEPIEFDEIAAIWQQLQTDACDLLATLKYHKIMILQDTNTIPDKPSSQEIEALINHGLDADCKKHKIKPSRIETLISRQNEIKTRYHRVNSDMTSLSTMTLGTLAGAAVSLGYMPDKLNPLIKPLMDSIKKEPIIQLQKLSAQKLVLLLDLCISNKIPNPAEKVTRNLIHFAYGDQYSESEKANIISLKMEEDAATTLADNVQIRGTKEALRTIVTHFGRQVTSKPPKFFDRVVVPFLLDHLWSGLTYIELVQFLNTFLIVADAIDASLHIELLKTYECLSHILCHSKSVPRHLAAKCFAALASFKPNETISAVISLVITNLESPNVTFRQGAIEALAAIVNQLGLKFVPYIVLFIVPVLGRMSDPDAEVRQLATSMFANLIKLIPLDGNTLESNEQDLPKHLIDMKMKQKSFIDELMNLNNVQAMDLPVKVNAELRSYQVDGIKWLSFLNRYKLHGILCDDMGLGKTLQTICMLASDHFERATSTPPQSPIASLIVCPATLCFHWASEIKKFVEPSSLTPFVYNGPMSQRLAMKRQLSQALERSASHLAVITSYEIVRSDADLFKLHQWNYLVLDEGHAIRNAKTKTTAAIKSLKAYHRLILSGTPIQNSVLELWSLFDFLMPGFLGSERQFNAKYTRPIIGSRSDGKAVSKENKEAGVLAMEALHRQVLPFVLRRMKEDVLKDLPPKITQDYYCELSPIQKLLYEDFAKEQKDKTNNKAADKAHVFQALQYLRKVCNHPKLVLHKEHKQYELVQRILADGGSNLNALSHATKLPALKQLLNECGIGNESSSGQEEIAVVQHRALVFCQLKAMMDIVEKDLLKAMCNVSYLRLDGSVPAADRHEIVTKFNNDVSIDLLLLSTSVGGLGLNLTGADTVIFVEHDWNPMKDLQAMDRAHRIGQKKVVNVYRLITRNTVEEKILGLQKFKLKTANSVITRDNSSLSSMATDQLFDLFSLDDNEGEEEASFDRGNSATSQGKKDINKSGGGVGVKALLENLPELWDESQYSSEYDLEAYTSSR